jgi:hypothetical protein
MFGSPQKEHQWLEQFLGDWTYEGECDGEPGKPKQKVCGVETVSPLGGFWVQGVSEGECPGGAKARNIITLGFDTTKNTYVGVFVSSMMSNLWVYEKGTLDAAGKSLALHCEGPAFTGKGTCKYIDTVEWIDKNTRTLSSQFQSEDGKWIQFMTSTYKRKKS